jgi:hypothetical protein
MKEKATTGAEPTLELYERLVKTVPGVERKGVTLPYTSRNGHMFSFVTQAGRVALRLPDEERNAFLSKYRTVLCEQHGVVMKEYVLVPDALLARTSELKPWFAKSHAYVGSLKPKPTTRAKGSQSTKKSAASSGNAATKGAKSSSSAKPTPPARKKAARSSARSPRKS